jgi:hypothetical protein
LKLDRAEYWISKGAQPSDTVRSLIKKNKKQVASAPAEAKPEPPGPPAHAEAAPAAAPERPVAETADEGPTES